MTAGEITFVRLVRYLQLAGWHRDGDDPGVWIPPNGTDGKFVGSYQAMSFGDALQLQLEADGVSMESVA